MSDSNGSLLFLIEDNDNIREAVKPYLELEGYNVKDFGTLKEASKALLEKTPDLIILDVMLPDGDGFLFARKNIDTKKTALIFLTAKVTESDRITGLELGADDYILKPFSTRELVLRVNAVLNRSGKLESKSSSSNIIEYKNGESTLKIDRTGHQAMVDSRPVILTAAEWNILIFLGQHRNQVVSRGQILENCLDSIADGSERTVDTHIKNLRQKLGMEEWITTVRGFGYRFEGEE